MALYSMLRRASSSSVALAIGINNGRLFDDLSRVKFVPSLHFSTATIKHQSPDESLVRIVDSEIKCAVESEEHYRAERIPDWFPFVIQDKPGERIIVLKREYRDEIITVEVGMPDLRNLEDSENGDESQNQPTIPLVMKLTKRSPLFLQFEITAFPDKVSIDSLFLKELESSENRLTFGVHEFSDLNEKLQKSFQKYLEIRGIKPSTTNFLYEYMIGKDSKEYLQWLKNLKNFVDCNGLNSSLTDGF